MNQFISQNNKNVVNIGTNNGDIVFPTNESTKNAKQSSDYLFGFLGLLAFFGLLTFAIIYSPSKTLTVSNIEVGINNNSNNQTNITHRLLNSSVTNQIETVKRVNINLNSKDSKKKITPTIGNRNAKKKERNSFILDFTPSDCSGKSNGCD